MNKFLFTIGAVLLVGLGWLFVERPQPPFGAVLTVKQKLEGKVGVERWTTKGQEIAKLVSVDKVRRTSVYFNGYLQIVSFNPIDGGVEVFVRAWDKNDQQIGFGSDGSVDIERFVIINPPIMVPDGTTHIETLDGRPVEIDNYREDLKEAVLQSLEHTIKVKTQKFDNLKIKSGKVGSTTTTAYPAAGTNAPVDGEARSGTGAETFATKRAGAGAENSSTNASSSACKIETTTTNWWQFNRGVFGFDVSSIGDTDTIDSGVLSLDGIASTDNFAQSVVIDRNPPASDNAMANGDYNVAGWDEVEQSTARIALSVWSTNYNDFTLSATGKGNVSKTGYTWFGCRLSGDFDNSAPTFAADSISGAGMNMADQTDTTQDPKLVIESTAVAEDPNKQNIIWTD